MMVPDAATIATFEAVVSTERPLLVRAAARIAGPLWAEDSTQTALCNAWRGLAQFTGDAGDMRKWLLTITCNAARDWYRAQAARPQTCSLDPPSTGEGTGTSEDRQGWVHTLVDDDWRVAPELVAERREALAAAREQVTPLLAALRPRTRTMVWRTAALGIPRTEVAAQMGTTWQTIKTVRSRGLDRCRELVERNKGYKHELHSHGHGDGQSDWLVSHRGGGANRGSGCD